PHGRATGARAQFVFPRAGADAASALRRELGEVIDAPVPADLADAYEKLTSPFRSLDIGDLCYYGGKDPEGRVATRAPVKAGREDLLRNVLHGPNPEGRLYAARGLRELGALNANDKAVLTRLLKLNVRVSICVGCMGGQASSQEAWRSLDKA